MLVELFILLLTVPVLFVVNLIRKRKGFDKAKLNGKNVMITGASSGIGKDMALLYSSFGANVFVTARREELLRELVTECQRRCSNGKHGYVVMDMADIPKTEECVKEAVKILGGIDYLVLNHGFIDNHTMYWRGTERDLKVFHDTMKINMDSYIHLTAHALPYLEQSSAPGGIAVAGSIYGKLPVPFIPAYCTSKFAVDGFFGSLRQELKMRQGCNVNVTFLNLGYIDTDLTTVKLPRLASKHILPAASPEDTALASIEAITSGQDELYYPRRQWLLPWTTIRMYFPALVDWLLRFEPEHEHKPQHKNL